MYKYGNSALKKLKNRVNNSEGPAKDGVKFAAKQGAKEAIKKFAGNIAAKVFGAAGMILTPTTVYAGGEKKGGTITNEELKEQSKLIPEETQEQFQARMAKQNK